MEIHELSQAAPTAVAQPRPERVVAPLADIVETEENILLLADIPGAEIQDVDLQCENGVLTLSATVPARGPAEPLLREFELGTWQRSFRLGDDIDPSKISAEMRNGVLTVTLPKAERVRPRRITIQGS